MNDPIPDAPPYQIRALIQQAHIGAVYRAYDPRRKCEVVLKGLWGDSPLSEAERLPFFTHEADMLRRIDHPQVPAFYEMVEGEQPYMALGFIDGDDLQTRLDTNPEPIPIPDLLDWAIQVCDVLDYLHHLKPPIVCRDLKPSHIVIDRDNRAWLVDFNLAMVLPRGGVAREASLEGTEGFAAPEQYKGVVCAASDQFALGATLHYLVTRRNPRLEKPFSFRQARPASITPDCPPGLEAAILRAVRLSPARRFATIRGLRMALKRVRKRLKKQELGRV